MTDLLLTAKLRALKVALNADEKLIADCLFHEIMNILRMKEGE